VFELLRESQGVASLGREGHVLWETFHHPEEHDWRSNEVRAEDVTATERRYLAWAIPQLGGPGRFVDKTPRNTLRLSYLDSLFPGARYVFISRDGRAVVSSLIVGWRARPRPAYVLPEGLDIPGVPDRHWHFVLSPGWRSLKGASLEEVCTHQYLTSTQAMLDFEAALPADRLTTVRYEDLLDDPVGEVERLSRSLGLPFGPADEQRTRAKVRRPEGPPKWQTLTPAEIEHVLPRLRPMLERTGYGD
jgi:hypothetical protein